MAVTIPLGTEACVSQLFSFPNSPATPWTLADTVKHWVDLTLVRDGLAAQGAQASVSIGRSGYLLTLDGPPALQTQLMQYAVRLPRFLENGWQALTTVVPTLQAFGRWDPSPDAPAPGSPPYAPWRFFLPLGMAMLNQKALLFFHYPPIRLLDTNQDYLNDPVPVRCAELLAANGVTANDLPLFNRVMDATPIGAEDDQGAKTLPDHTTPAVDPVWGVIPIQYFHDYQRAQVTLLLNTSSVNQDYTVPIVVYGAHPLATFNELYGLTLSNNQVTVASIIPGKKTPVVATTHPYVFYGRAQGFDAIGSGKLVDVAGATAQMTSDLAVAGWLKRMSDDPAQDPQAVLSACQQYWKSSAQAAMVSALVQHQGSLKYSDPNTLAFEFLVPLAAPAAQPPAKAPVAPIARAAKKTAATRAASVASAPAASPLAAAPQRAALPAGGLSAIGDSGKPVDWWFIYKVAAQGAAQGTAKAAVGDEYTYFDSEMARNPQAKLMLSTHRIRDAQSALVATLAQLTSSAAKANRSLGWYCYDDEDRVDNRGEGQGPPWDCGHCKGVLAFDLATNTAFWLIHSVPLYPWPPAWQYRDGELKMAQTMLCISLADAEAAKAIAQLMYDAHSPNVYLASDLLANATGQLYGYPAASLPLSDVLKRLGPTDPRVQLMKNMNAAKSGSTKPYAGQVRFLSRAGQPFTAMAKNKAWDKDFYNDLVGRLLNEDIDVETWERTKAIPPEKAPGETHNVVNMQGVNLAPLAIPYAWPKMNDHAKLAISNDDNPAGSRWVCVGDINFTDAQEKRGGGTVAFQCDPLWSSLSAVLTAKTAPAAKTVVTGTRVVPRAALPLAAAAARGVKPNPAGKIAARAAKAAVAVKQLVTRPKPQAAKGVRKRGS
jgi:deoxyribonuclease-2